MCATTRHGRETADYSLTLAVNHPVSSLGDSFQRKIINSIRASASSDSRASLFKHGLDLFTHIWKMQLDIAGIHRVEHKMHHRSVFPIAISRLNSSLSFSIPACLSLSVITFSWREKRNKNISEQFLILTLVFLCVYVFVLISDARCWLWSHPPIGGGINFCGNNFS